MLHSLRSVGLACLLFVLASAVVVGFARGEARAGSADQSQIILMRCTTGGSEFRVTAYTGSSSAPSSRATSCADNLALLTKEGFEIRDIGHYDGSESTYVVFTLQR